MQFRTSINISPSTLSLDHSKRVVMIGSCFSEHIAERMRCAGFHVTSNPFGIMFNPASIARTIERLTTAQPYSIDDLRLSGSAGLCAGYGAGVEGNIEASQAKSAGSDPAVFQWQTPLGGNPAPFAGKAIAAAWTAGGFFSQSAA